MCRKKILLFALFGTSLLLLLFGTRYAALASSASPGDLILEYDDGTIPVRGEIPDEPAPGEEESVRNQTETANAPVRIMPLGDSITVGSYSGVEPNDAAYFISYRKKLFESLEAAGYDVDFVGNESGGYAYPGFDPDHEGHGGFTDEQIASGIYSWLSSSPADVILLHIGTNALDVSPDDVENILEAIDAYENDNGVQITVLVARIINRLGHVCPDGSPTTTFNNNVAAMVQNRIATLGDRLLLVDMECGAGMDYRLYTEVPEGGDMYDDVHPVASGYEKMADPWMQALASILNRPPDITDPGPHESAENESINLPIQISDLNDEDHSFAAGNLPPGVGIGQNTGVISGTVSFEAYTGLPYTTVVTVTDPGIPAYTDTIAFTWTITNTNRPPSVTNIPTQIYNEGEEVLLQVEASDPDSGDQLTFSVADLPPGLQIDTQTGLISGDISFTAYTGFPYNSEVTATDNGAPSYSDTVTFTWEITNTNRPPTLTAIQDQERSEGQAISLAADASDPDSGDQLTFSLSGLPPGLQIDSQTGVISGTIAYDAFTGEDYVTVLAVTDDGIPFAASESITFTWKINDVNRPPVVEVEDVASLEGQPVTVTIEASDPDQDDLLFQAVGLPPGLTIDPDQGLISGLIPLGVYGDFPVEVTIDDGDDSVQADFTWTVIPAERIFIPIAVRR